MTVENTKRFYGMIGFAMRAGKVLIGTETVCKAMQKPNKGKIAFVLIPADASDLSRKKVADKSTFYGLPYAEVDVGMAELGRTLGKLYAPAAIAITDTAFAEEIRKAIGNTVSE